MQPDFIETISWLTDPEALLPSRIFLKKAGVTWTPASSPSNSARRTLLTPCNKGYSVFLDYTVHKVQLYSHLFLKHSTLAWFPSNFARRRLLTPCNRGYSVCLDYTVHTVQLYSYLFLEHSTRALSLSNTARRAVCVYSICSTDVLSVVSKTSNPVLYSLFEQ